MKKLATITFLIFVLILVCTCFVACEDPTYYTAGLQFELFYSNGYVDGDEYVVVGYNGYDTEVVIPSEYGGKPVTIIDYMAFKDCTHIKSVSIPESIKEIGNHAFWNCENLENVTFPKNLEALEGNPFYGCNLIKYEVREGLKYIGDGINKESYLVGTTSTNLEVAKVSDKCKLIAESVFSNSPELRVVYIPRSVIYISGCLEGWNEYEELTFYCEAESKPEGWTSIWNSAGRGEYPVIWGANMWE